MKSDRAAETFARVAWATVTEPNDHIAGRVVRAIGAAEAWNLLVQHSPERFELGPTGLLKELLAVGVAEKTSMRVVSRWARRLHGVNPEETIRRTKALGAKILTPEAEDWPTQLDDLDDGTPFCLWVRGDVEVLQDAYHGAALVGARAQTPYGEHVTAHLAQGLGAENRVVTSGGAFGVDATAHRVALNCSGKTLAVSAGGVDRNYPAGNANLLRAIISEGGAVCSELPLGALPMKSRFLSRNRLIAALSGATVVVEAAWRSGALSTAHHALEMGRPVGAVPGPITSTQSAGTHRLLKSNLVALVTDVVDVIRLLGGEPDNFEADRSLARSNPHEVRDLDPGERRVIDGMSLKRGLHEEQISLNCGLVPIETLQILGALEMRGIVKRDLSGWRLV